MKNILIGAMITMSIVVTLAFHDTKNEAAGSPEKTWVIAPRFLHLKEGVSKNEARTWLEKEYLPLYRQFPGFNAMLGEPVKTAGWGGTDSTGKEKDFVIIYFFDSKETYDRYFPKEGLNEEIKEARKRNQSVIDRLFGKYFIQEKYQFEDYLMYASSK
jgi:hypothetical protein